MTQRNSFNTLKVQSSVLTHSLNSVLVSLYKCLQYGGCVPWWKTEGGEGLWNWHYFTVEWEFDCSISRTLIMSFPISQHLIPVLMHSAKLVPMNTHRFASMMMNWYNTLRHGNRERFPPWKTDAKNTHIQHFTISVERLVCILGTVGVRHRANLPPATSQASSKQFWPSDLQAIYEIWIIPRWGRKCPGILCCVCVIHVTAEWVRDRDDCLWDGVGMRNHHNGNVFVLSRAHQRAHMPEYEWCAHVHMPIQTQVRLLPGVRTHTHTSAQLWYFGQSNKSAASTEHNSPHV